MARPKKEPEQSNVTDETIKQFGTQALSAKAELDDAKATQNAAAAVFRKVLANADAAGIPKGIIQRFIKERSQPQGELDLFEQQYSRFRQVMGPSSNVTKLRPLESA
jgi:hypothetical protein